VYGAKLELNYERIREENRELESQNKRTIKPETKSGF